LAPIPKSAAWQAPKSSIPCRMRLTCTCVYLYHVYSILYILHTIFKNMHL
jgi:hypothetical protein